VPRTRVRQTTIRGLPDCVAADHAIFEEYTPLIQPLSIDEAYLDVTENPRGLPTAWATVKEIRTRILEETGLTASAGISYNKFPAKLASGHRGGNLCARTGMDHGASAGAVKHRPRP
jgi:DNA polymerase-4